jgi:hypothetical protein
MKTPETITDIFEHHFARGQWPLVYHFTYNEGVEQLIEEGKGWAKFKIEGYKFEVNRIEWKDMDVTDHITDFISPEEHKDILAQIEECICGPEVPPPPPNWNGNWF